MKCSWISKITHFLRRLASVLIAFSGHQKMDVMQGSKPLDVLSRLPYKT